MTLAMGWRSTAMPDSLRTLAIHTAIPMVEPYLLAPLTKTVISITSVLGATPCWSRPPVALDVRLSGSDDFVFGSVVLAFVGRFYRKVREDAIKPPWKPPVCGTKHVHGSRNKDCSQHEGI